MKIVFMGTPDFAVDALDAIVAAGHEVVLVVTQPDKPKGRGKDMAFSAVKECALKHDLPVFQPVKIKTTEAVEELKKYEADLFVVAAFGQILSKEILDMPRFGCVNIHASLLPKYRGAAPIQWAVIDGEAKSGVTIMQMDVGLDTGDILMQREVELDKNETGASLFDKLAKVGSEAIVEAIPLIEQGKLVRQKQEEAKSTYAKMLTKETGKIDFTKSAKEIERLVRGCNSWPSAYSYLDGKLLKIWECDVVECVADKKPGEIVAVNKDSFDVKCGENAIRVTNLQLEGKKRMITKDFLLGYSIKVGDYLNY